MTSTLVLLLIWPVIRQQNVACEGMMEGFAQVALWTMCLYPPWYENNIYAYIIFGKATWLAQLTLWNPHQPLPEVGDCCQVSPWRPWSKLMLETAHSRNCSLKKLLTWVSCSWAALWSCYFLYPILKAQSSLIGINYCTVFLFLQYWLSALFLASPVTLVLPLFPHWSFPWSWPLPPPR